MQKGDIVGLVIVIALLVGVGAFFAYAPQAVNAPTGPIEVPGSSLVVLEAAERTLHVGAEVKEPGFVTVHQAIGDAPGPIIGSSPLLESGSYADLSVNVTEALSPLGDYFVLLFVDDGNGVFEAGKDRAVMTEGVVIKQPVSL